MKRIVIDDRSGIVRIIGVVDDEQVPSDLNDGERVFTPVVFKRSYVVYRPPLTPSGALGVTFHSEQR